MSTDTASLVEITLHLARSKEYPNGSTTHGYRLIAPLDRHGHIDAGLWRKNPDICTVTRFWGNQLPAHGRLVHRPGGADGANWGFDYDRHRQDDDEVGFRFANHSFVPGEYVSLRDPDGAMHTFRVEAVEPV
jgi:hypothetical protein